MSWWLMPLIACRRQPISKSCSARHHLRNTLDVALLLELSSRDVCITAHASTSLTREPLSALGSGSAHKQTATARHQLAHSRHVLSLCRTTAPARSSETARGPRSWARAQHSPGPHCGARAQTRLYRHHGPGPPRAQTGQAGGQCAGARATSPLLNIFSNTLDNKIIH